MTDTAVLIAVLAFGGIVGGFTALFLFTQPEDKEARAALKIWVPKVKELERNVKWLIKNHVTSSIEQSVEETYRNAKQH